MIVTRVQVGVVVLVVQKVTMTSSPSVCPLTAAVASATLTSSPTFSTKDATVSASPSGVAAVTVTPSETLKEVAQPSESCT